MASIGDPTEQSLIKSSYRMESKPMMLKDYLRDDLGSCSSNGFRSFPRRQCCTTIRFLLEIDLKARDSTAAKRILRRSRSKRAALSTISALQRASEAVINAVKQFPFPSANSPPPPPQNRPRIGFLRRRLLRKSFWRKADKVEPDIGRWRLFSEFLEEQHKPSDQNTSHSITTATSAAIIVPNRASTSSATDSNSWGESELTCEISQSSSGNSISTLYDVVESTKQLPGKKVGEDSMERPTTPYPKTNTKEWPNEEEKEQFSPVSVLDFPFEEDEVTSSPSPYSLAQGTKQQLMQKKIRRLESITHLEPLDLQKRFSISDLPTQTDHNTISTNKEYRTEQKAHEFLTLTKSKNPSNSFICKAEILLLDFFQEKIEETESNHSFCRNGGDEFEQEEIVNLTQDWINGCPQDLLLGWEVENGRTAYISEMEKGGRWRNFEEEKEEMGFDLEVEIWTSLLNELIIELF